MPGNIPRVLPEGLGASINPSAWPMPSVMQLFGALGGVEDDELRATFNGGIGMVLVVPPAAVARLGDDLWKAGVPAWPIGTVRPVEELGGRRYMEASASAR